MAARLLVAAALAGALLGACGDGTAGKGTLLITLRYAADVPEATRRAVQSFDFEVSGAERYARTTGVTNELDGGSATIRFVPRATSGSLNFRVTLRDGAQAPLAGGEGLAAIDAEREVPLFIELHAGAPGDGGVADLGPRPGDGSGDKPDATVGDAGAPDLAVPPDLTTSVDATPPPTDLPADLAMPDLAEPRDLATPPDLVTVPDLVTPPDLVPPPVIPSHTALPLLPGAGNLTAALAVIDTANLVLRDGKNAVVPLPPGATFAFEVKSGSAVLRVGGFTVAKNNPIAVVGNAPLIVLASGAVSISSRIDASAVRDKAGPGGFTAGGGSGKGTSGSNLATDKPGGSGAGFRDVGGAGGNGNATNGPAGGASYGGLLGDWEAGSGGGNGAGVGTCDAGGQGGNGGAGGGGVQITSAVSITVDKDGALAAGGGGGTHGCPYLGVRASGGGGGGSGGILLLEAPVVTVAGGLFANGGGGGGGGDLLGMKFGGDGQDGPLSAMAAAGGTASGNGGAGGSGGSDVAPTTSPTPRQGLQAAGGGGGSAGRIFVRSRGPANLGGVSSPAAILRTDL